MVDPIISQSSAVIAELYKQCTGQSVMAPVDLSSFISIATTLQRTNKDILFNAITAMWRDTVFAVRPYRGQLLDMEFDTNRWTNASRKISFASKMPMDNAAYTYPAAYDATQTPPTGDGLSVDMYKIEKDKPVETVFYGQSTYIAKRTQFWEQLETALSTPELLASYNAAALQALENDRESWAEQLRHGLLINLIGSLVDESAASPELNRVHKVLTAYNADTGLSLTKEDVYKPANLAPFARWLHAYITHIAARMRKNTTLYTTQLSQLTQQGLCVLRHTPAERLRVKITDKLLTQMRACVLSATYNQDLLSLDGAEGVVWWQAPELEDSVRVAPVYTNADGEQTQGTPRIVDNIIGVMYDADALGCAVVSESMYTTPFNISGEYVNTEWKQRYKTRFDMTEKAVVLLLE